MNAVVYGASPAAAAAAAAADDDDDVRVFANLN